MIIVLQLAYMKKAYTIDSLNFRNIVPYFNMLVEDKKYEEAYNFMGSENYKSVLNKKWQLKNLWYYHYLKGDSIRSSRSIKRYHVY